jgi:hypothetical protein
MCRSPCPHVSAPSRRCAQSLAAVRAAMLCGAACRHAVAAALPAPWRGAFFLLAAARLLHRCGGATKTHRIDVSGTGTMRLTVQQETREPTAASASDQGASRCCPQPGLAIRCCCCIWQRGRGPAGAGAARQPAPRIPGAWRGLAVRCRQATPIASSNDIRNTLNLLQRANSYTGGEAIRPGAQANGTGQ